MEPYYYDSHISLYNKSCLDMSELADETVQMVVTSPPYWGLRKYSGEQELIWGNNHCEHQWGDLLLSHHPGQVQDNKAVTDLNAKGQTQGSGHFCSLCGAWKGAYGLEPTPEMYIEHTIEILREIRRVLRKDGVVFWNIGDSYWGGKGQSGQGSPEYQEARRDVSLNKPYHQIAGSKQTRPSDGRHYSIKPKDLCLIPFRVAVSAQMDGWWVRSVIIWSKNNPMPESVTDRPTESHEYILMLTKSGTNQYWTHRGSGGTRVRPKADYRWVNIKSNEEVVVEPLNWKERITCPDCEGASIVSVYLGLDVWQDVKCTNCPTQGKYKGKVLLWKRINLWRGHDYYWDADAVREQQTGGAHSRGTEASNETYQEARASYKGFRSPVLNLPAGRNIRSVWEFPTQPYPEAHFAVFPEKLPEICIRVATPEVGCCSKCGAPWVRVTESKQSPRHDTEARDLVVDGNGSHRGKHAIPTQTKTLGWQPTCECNGEKVPSLVFDPFAGSGTTLAEAKILNRKAVGCEVAKEYCELIVKRCRQQVMADMGVSGEKEAQQADGVPLWMKG